MNKEKINYIVWNLAEDIVKKQYPMLKKNTKEYEAAVLQLFNMIMKAQKKGV